MRDSKGHKVADGRTFHVSDNKVIDSFKLATGTEVTVTTCKLCGAKLTRKKEK
jgi:hypothetical protein